MTSHAPPTDGRIAATFSRLRAGQTPGLVTYVTAGDPDLPRTAGILRALDRAGADVLEIGVPFSDPLADGPDLERAAQTALEGGATMAFVLECARAFRATDSPRRARLRRRGQSGRER